jgi:hypothetical protein
MLWRKTPPVEGASAPRGAEVGRLVHPSKALRIFVSDIRDRTSPQLLDAGQVIGSNIEYFARMGCKVFVHDVLADRVADLQLGKPPKQFVRGTRWGGLPYSDEQFDGLLAWDLLDYFGREEVPSVISELFRVLKKNALLFGLFCRERAQRADPSQRYRIVDTGMLEHDPISKGNTAKFFVTRLRNREILDAFVPHRVLHFIMLKNSMREIVVRK